MGNAKNLGRPQQKGSSPFQERFIELVGNNSTQAEIAEKIGTSRQNVGNWIKGDTKPDIYTLTEIARAYNVSTDYLLGLTDIKATSTTVRDMCIYTGLKEKTVENISKLRNAKPKLGYDELFSLSDILNIFIDSIISDGYLFRELYKAFNFNAKKPDGYDPKDSVIEDFERQFPDAAKWVYGKLSIVENSDTYSFLIANVQDNMRQLLDALIHSYNPTSTFQDLYEDIRDGIFFLTIFDFCDNSKPEE